MALSDFERDNKRPQEGSPGLFFLDSGAHTWYNNKLDEQRERDALAKQNSEDVQRRDHGQIDYSSMDIDLPSGREFRKYIDRYARFCRRHKNEMDYYVTVDVIFNPELSWKTLKYMESEFDLTPVPVIHHGTDVKWIKRHLDAGYEFLGIGGLGQIVTKEDYYIWADAVFTMLCPESNNFEPIARTHGFAMTAYELLLRYPWWSVDSTSWLKCAGFGGIYLPAIEYGEYVFTKQPTQINVSSDSPAAVEQGNRSDHIATATPKQREGVLNWLKLIDVPLGSVDAEGNPETWGVVSSHPARKIANLRFFEKLIEWIGPYPTKYQPRLISSVTVPARSKSNYFKV